MHRIGKYNAADSMSGLITGNYRALPVLSRFGIPLGFGDKSIGEVCLKNDVDTNTFLAVINLLLNEDGTEDYTTDDISVASMLSYLHSSHDYFLKFRLPRIRAGLAEVVGSADDLARAIMAYFDEYVAEVDKHMMYEEKTVFPYVRSLLDGVKNPAYDIDVFSRHHDQVEARLSEFKNIIVKYYPAKSTNTLNAVLFDIFNTENDLASHNAIEDILFVPAIRELEKKAAK